MADKGLKSIEFVSRSCKHSREVFLGSWKKDNLFNVITGSAVERLPGITWKLENIPDKLARVARVSTQRQVPAGHLVLYIVRYPVNNHQRIELKRNGSIFKHNPEELETREEFLCVKRASYAQPLSMDKGSQTR